MCHKTIFFLHRAVTLKCMLEYVLTFCLVYLTQGTPIQGSKLRLPGYLSGKGFHSTEESSLLTAASTKVKAQFAGKSFK